MRLEEKKSLPFLDILISRKKDNSITHNVYRKKTQIDQYLHASFHHHPSQKMGTLNMLLTRAMRISYAYHLELEIEDQQRFFLINGYMNSQIKKALNKI